MEFTNQHQLRNKNTKFLVYVTVMELGKATATEPDELKPLKFETM